MSSQPLAAQVYAVKPTITVDNLKPAEKQASAFVSRPIEVSANSIKDTIDEAKLLSWIDVSTPGGRSDMPLDPLKSFYGGMVPPTVNIAFNPDKIEVYVKGLAAKVDRSPQNAVLSMQDGSLHVLQPSRDGLVLNQDSALQQIISSVTSPQSNRSLKLATKTTPADVNENNLDKLGIKDQISEGQTFFPGSPTTRLQNIRVGAARYNGVLLKPGETFSFGKILGDVGPEQGYVPELVILGDHEEKQYGGGLCQVASTAFRAALLAGFPIMERVNHSFAVSYYTAPYNAPGVDATIYYPQVDFKFKNDSDHYVLIQTKMEGTTLTFDYFGTKTKYGEIRGPQFVTGTNDATQPSHTVFWRDIKDLSGNVIKTNQFDTYYKSSKDFPINKQFN